MTFAVGCECGATIRVKDELREKTRRCPKCKAPLLLVPASTEVEPVSILQPQRAELVVRTNRQNKHTVPLVVSACVIGAMLVSVALYMNSSPAQPTLTPTPRINTTQSSNKSASPLSSVGDDITEQDTTTETVKSHPTAAKRPQFAAPRPATGIKESILLKAMNFNVLADVRYHHEFTQVTLKDNGTPTRIAIYRDSHSEIYLMVHGSSGDLTLIQLIMPLEAFFGEKDGQTPGEGAGAFGRCVQRMAAAADPSWVADLYAWMNESMAHALVHPDGITTTKNHLMVQFHSFKTSEDEMMVSMKLGIPAESPAE